MTPTSARSDDVVDDQSATGGHQASPRALPAIALVYLLVFASSGIHLPLTSVAMEAVGLSPTAIGAMWGARSLATAFAPFLWGLAADRIGQVRALLALAIGMGAVLMAVLSTTTTPWVCVALFATYGATAGATGSMLDGMTLTALGPARADFGRWRAAGTVGFGASSLVVTVLLEQGVLQAVPRSLFPCCAVLLLAASVVVARFVPPVPRPSLKNPRLVLVVFAQPLLLGLVLLGGLLWCSHGAWSGFLAVLVEHAGMPVSVTGAAVAFAVMTEIVVMASAPRLVSRLGVKTILVSCASLAAVRWMCASMMPSSVFFVIVHGLHGVTFGLFFVVVVGIVAERCPPELRQASQGLLASLVYGVGGFFGSTLCGTVFERTGDVASVWRAMAVVAAVAVVVAVVVVRRLSRERA
jgi:PPP family 3-phenylpropionic acid transporter